MELGRQRLLWAKPNWIKFFAPFFKKKKKAGTVIRAIEDSLLIAAEAHVAKKAKTRPPTY